jgi:broad specificity phosphatase PhoE
MSSEIQWVIPPSVLHWLQNTPNDKPVVLLMRHSVRDDLPPGDAGFSLPITEIGVRLAKELGEHIGSRLKSLHASPLVRCMQTAEALSEGAQANLTITPDNHLGLPGVFVLDGDIAQQNWDSFGHERVMDSLVSDDEPLPGMARPAEAARFLVHKMLAATKGVPGLHIFVTHDSLVTATAAQLLSKQLGAEAWPWYLESAFFWSDDCGLNAAYREGHAKRIPEPLCGLNEHDVIEFAKREIAATVGLECGARFFLAGGAFKTLLTGHPPRDLDLWAPSENDRKLLIFALKEKGAKRLHDRPYSEAFEIGNRIVEIPLKTTPSTLEGRLAKFDLALSSIGVEHHQGQRWSANIHPKAVASAERREILLLKPLVNWKHSLATLERMRRYAIELDFAIPTEEETEVWSILNEQTPETQREMMDRFRLSSKGNFGVAEDASRRCLY